MTARTLPGLGLTGFWDLHAGGWKDAMDTNLLTLSALVQLVVKSSTTALPGSPINGDIYIVPSGAGTNPNKIAIRDNGAWVYLTPTTGMEAYAIDSGAKLRFGGSTWAATGGSTLVAKDEGSVVDSAITSFDFVGAGVATTTDGSGHATVTIPGATGGGGATLEGAFTAPPAASTWTKQNFDSTKTHLVDFSSPCSGVRIYEDVYAYGNVNSIRYALKAIPGAHWDVKTRLRRHTRLTSYMSWGLVVRDSASSKSAILGFSNEANGITAVQFTNDTTYSGFSSFGGNQMPWMSDIWLRITYDGTDCTFWQSMDGVYWTVAKKYTGTGLWGFLTNPATHIGFGYNTNNNGGTDLGQELDLLSWSAVALA